MPRYDTYATPRADLGQALYEYMISPDQYIGIQALPVTPVPRRAATYSKFQREAMLRDRKIRRASGAGYARDTGDYEDDTYTCLEYGFETLLDDGDRAHFASDFDADADAAFLAEHVVLREQEKRIAAALFNTTTWTGSTLTTDVSANPWSTTTTDVMTQLNNAKEKVRVLTGMWPDTLIINHQNFLYLKNNDDMIGRVVYSQRADDSNMGASLAEILGFRRILVGGAIRNSAIEGQAITATNIWSTLYAMVAVTCPQGPLTPTPGVGRTMIWSGDGAGNVQVEQYRDESRRSDVFRVRQYVAEEIIDASYAHLLTVNT